MSRQLWQAVLARAVEDAVHGVPVSGVLPERREFETQEARRFLTRPSADLDLVCTFAGVDPEAVRDRMRLRIDKEKLAERQNFKVYPALQMH